MQVTFREMADEHPDADAGDVIFVLKQQAGPAGQGMGESASFGVASQQCEREKPQEDSTTTSEGSEPPPPNRC